MSAPSEGYAVDAWYDGDSAVRRAPRLVPAGEGFLLVEAERTSGPFAFADLVGLGSHGGATQFGLKGRSGWRLDLAEPVPDELLARLPAAPGYGGVFDRLGLWAAAAICAVLAVGVVVALGRAPSLVARLIPASVERQIGSAMVGDFGNRGCDAPRGQAALDALIARLGPAAAPASIRVVNVPIVNAVTLPGGHVLLFDGLIQKAASPDEVTGVLAHELGHVANRDVLASLIRQLGLSVVLGGIGGDAGGWVNTLLSAGYSRDAERRADDFALRTLTASRISPAATAAFFGRLAKGEQALGRAGTVIGYLSSHPLSVERQARFSGAARPARGGRPALDAAQWAALRAICKEDRDVSRTEFRF